MIQTISWRDWPLIPGAGTRTSNTHCQNGTVRWRQCELSEVSWVMLRSKSCLKFARLWRISLLCESPNWLSNLDINFIFHSCHKFLVLSGHWWVVLFFMVGKNENRKKGISYFFCNYRLFQIFYKLVLRICTTNIWFLP